MTPLWRQQFDLSLTDLFSLVFLLVFLIYSGNFLKNKSWYSTYLALSSQCLCSYTLTIQCVITAPQSVKRGCSLLRHWERKVLHPFPAKMCTSLIGFLGKAIFVVVLLQYCYDSVVTPVLFTLETKSACSKWMRVHQSICFTLSRCTC